MKTIMRRVRALEEVFGAGEDDENRLVDFPLEEDAIWRILGESGFNRRNTVMVDLGGVPWHLTADEAERYLREHAAEITCPRPTEYSPPAHPRGVRRR